MSFATLEILWYCVFIIVICGYVILDGFDLGVGALHLISRNDTERRIFLNAIGPVWDGNEVWLIIVGGALFAGFPFAYATLMSAFYIPVMALLACIIFRAVAIEIRSKEPSKWWRSLWDTVFSVSSIVIALGLGLVLGNLIQGLRLDGNHHFAGSFFDFFTPFTILVSLLTLFMCAMHGAIYLVMKTEGETHDHVRKWIRPCLVLFGVFYIATTMATLIFHPHMADRFLSHPWLFIFPVLTLLCIANIPRCITHGKDGMAFISSSLAIGFLVVLYALGTFPNVVRSSIEPLTNSLTISNSYASEKTLQILLIIVAIGVPLALAYIITVYYVFRGKVKLDSTSY